LIVRGIIDYQKSDKNCWKRRIRIIRKA